jgi:hypothetical protein
VNPAPRFSDRWARESSFLGAASRQQLLRGINAGDPRGWLLYPDFLRGTDFNLIFQHQVGQ